MKAMQRIGWAVGWIVVASNLTGCATAAVSFMGATRHQRVQGIEQVKRAAIGRDDLVIEVEASRAKSGETSRHVLVLPLEDESWRADRGYRHRQPVSNQLDGQEILHLPVHLLAGSGDSLTAAKEIAVRNVIVDDLRTLWEMGAPGSEVTVLSVDYRPPDGPPELGMPSGKTHAHTGPLLAVVWRPGAEREPLIVAGFYESYRRWGWFALTPVALGVDAVTWPLQFLVIVIAMGEC